MRDGTEGIGVWVLNGVLRGRLDAIQKSESYPSEPEAFWVLAELLLD